MVIFSQKSIFLITKPLCSSAIWKRCFQTVSGSSGSRLRCNQGCNNCAYSYCSCTFTWIMFLSEMLVISHKAGWQMLRERRSTKSQGLLRKEGPLTYTIVAKPRIVSIYAFFERLSQGFQRKTSCFHRAFKESHLAFVELSTKAILLS